MRPAIFRNTIRTIWYYRKDAAYQIIIIAVLSAIITASLFTGYSVRSSLKKSSRDRLGNTNLIISSGIRYLDPSLSSRIKAITGDKTVSILETQGFCQNFNTGVTALNTKIYGITKDFFEFQGNDTLLIEPGTVAINVGLAEYLEIKKGDELIINFTETDPVPSNAPFSPGTGNKSRVMKVGRILTPSESGNFSLGISQLTPLNVFINIKEIGSESDGVSRANRLLVNNNSGRNDTAYLSILNDLLSPSDIGLHLRRSDKTGEPELISDRIFIDSAIVEEVLHVFPDASPILTYLANSISSDQKSTPYSFISALPASLYPGIPDNGLVVSKWLARDLECKTGDSVKLTWYYQARGNRLEETIKYFIVSDIIEDDSKYSDPSLMPEFPGISGSTTCSEWDAGVPILLDKIRKEDEEYWNARKGTPKAFISYPAGREIWSNDFGIATAIRFPGSMEVPEIEKELTGKINLRLTGVTVSDIAGRAANAAAHGVDFSTLFLSLSFFIILSGIILLIISISLFFNSRKNQVRTLYAIGYRNSTISRMLVTETMTIALAGAFLGAISGYFLNTLIIYALNTVWRGAVQTNMLTADFDLAPMLSGIAATMVIAFLIGMIKANSFLKSLKSSFSIGIKSFKKRLNIIPLQASFALAIVLVILSFINKENSTMLSFAAGSLIFVVIILILRHLIIAKQWNQGSITSLRHLSHKYYTFNTSTAITPVIFIAAGIFAVIIAGSNRQVISGKMLLPSGGTGGYLLWAESVIPINYNLNLEKGKTEFGLDEPDLAGLTFIQAKRLTGDDASCLNLNHITAPSILGLDADLFVTKGSFSFATVLKEFKEINPWEIINRPSFENAIYGIADQTVLEWGLKVKPGDTLKFSAENGQTLNIIICGGLKSSVFQGYILISEKNFTDFFPSVSGYSVFLADGKAEFSDYYQSVLGERLSRYGFSVMPGKDKLASFFQVTNTYLDVFTLLGALGMILGIVGMGFILMRNFNQRKKEFALMISSGFNIRRIRLILITDQVIIMIWGIVTGFISALAATLPSLKSGNVFPWQIVLLMLLLVSAVGLGAILLVIQNIKQESLVLNLREE